MVDRELLEIQAADFMVNDMRVKLLALVPDPAMVPDSEGSAVVDFVFLLLKVPG
jgi:hypothetical protein